MRLVIVLAVAWAFAPVPAAACSVVSGYRVPTNIELVAEADLVVLARVVGAGVAPPGRHYDNRVWLQPIRAIKGRAPARLQAYGHLTRFMPGREEPYPLMVTPLDRAHPSAGWGACLRQAYRKGGLVVAMFRKQGAGFVQTGAPFSRAIEDVSGPDGLWVRAAMLYAKILATTPPGDRRAAFAAERDRLLGRAGDAEARAIAEDIGRYLASPAAAR